MTRPKNYYPMFRSDIQNAARDDRSDAPTGDLERRTRDQLEEAGLEIGQISEISEEGIGYDEPENFEQEAHLREAALLAKNKPSNGEVKDEFYVTLDTLATHYEQLLEEHVPWKKRDALRDAFDTRSSSMEVRYAKGQNGTRNATGSFSHDLAEMGALYATVLLDHVPFEDQERVMNEFTGFANSLKQKYGQSKITPDGLVGHLSHSQG